MSRDDLDFNIDNIKTLEESYDFSDLEDLSLLPKTKKKDDEDDEDDDLEEKASKGIKILGIITLVIAVVAILCIGVMFLLDYTKKNSYGYVYNKGVEAYTQMDYETAIECFTEALTHKKDANNINERIYLYKSYRGLGDNDKAIVYLEELLDYDEFNLDAIKVVSEYYSVTNNMEKLNQLVERYKGTQGESAIAAYSSELPVVSYESGAYGNSIDVVLYSESGDSIFYTLDGSIPNENSTLYSAPIKIGKGTTVLKLVAINSAGIVSDVVEKTYVIDYVQPVAPEVSPASGTYDSDQQIIVSNIPEGVSAYYTLDGSIPTLMSEKYVAPIDIPGGNIIFSVATISDDNVSSDIVKRNYTLKVSEKYSFEKCIEQVKYSLIKKNELSADGLITSTGAQVKFVYYAKREINKKTMYLMYYDILVNDNYERQPYLFGVDIETGECYKVVGDEANYTAEKY